MLISCYRNLHKKTFSIQYKNKVIKHSDLVLLKDAIFKVSEKGRQRVLKEHVKNVHAKIIGTPFAYDQQMLDLVLPNMSYETFLMQGIDITYNPYVCGFFYEKNEKRGLQSAQWVLLYRGQDAKVIEPRYIGEDNGLQGSSIVSFF